MGYEVTMYIGRVDEYVVKENPKWFQVFAMLEMCKIGEMPKSLKDKGKPIFFFGTDGDTRITEDRYDDKLIAIPIADVKAYFKKKVNDDYLRYWWAYNLLNTLTSKTKELKAKNSHRHCTEPTHVFFFGH